MLDATYGLIIKFEDESPSFVLGYEAGNVHERLASGVPDLEGTYHTANVVVLGRIARHFGYEMTYDATTVPEWSEFTFWKSTRTKLHLVK